MKGGPNTGDAVLDTALADIWRFVTKPKVMEISAVRPAELWLELDGRGYVRETVPSLTIEWWKYFLGVLATRQRQVFDDQNPYVDARLPGGHRLSAMLGGFVEEGVSASIRIFRPVAHTLEGFGATAEAVEDLAAVGRTAAGGRKLSAEPITAGNLQDVLRAAARERLNILISGGTSSGKTSLANCLVKEVPESERVLVLEDVGELRLEHIPQRARFVVDRQGRGAVTPGKVFDHFMRARPDRVWLGEVSLMNAQACILLWSTGHRGMLGTIHSDSCEDAIGTAFHDRLTMGGQTVDRDHLTAYLRRNIDLVVQVAKTPVGRRLVEVWRPAIDEHPTVFWKREI